MSCQFITFEGVEGAGKTTQIQLTAEWLRSLNYPVKTTREPGGTELGQGIRQLLLQGGEVSDRAELLLLMADRSHHVETVIRPSIEQGKIVLCDRYSDSTIAYQGYGRGLDLGLIDTVNQIATNGLQPDLTFWFDLDVQIGLERSSIRASQTSGKLDRLERMDIGFHQRIAQGFQELAAQERERIVPIHASSNVEEVQKQIQSTLNQKLK